MVIGAQLQTGEYGYAASYRDQQTLTSTTKQIHQFVFHSIYLGYAKKVENEEFLLPLVVKEREGGLRQFYFQRHTQRIIYFQRHLNSRRGGLFLEFIDPPGQGINTGFLIPTIQHLMNKIIIQKGNKNMKKKGNFFKVTFQRICLIANPKMIQMIG